MNILGHNYLKIRNEGIIPVISYAKINLSEYKVHVLKNALIDHFNFVENPSSKLFYFTVPKSIINKALLAEAEQFYIRSLFQDQDQNLIKIYGSNSWQFTTQYYRYFFLLTSLQRILKKGYFFLNSEQASYLSDASNVFLHSIVKFEKGNYEFKIIAENASNDYIVSLKPAGSDVHKLMWYDFKTLINKLVANSKPGSDECAFLTLLKQKINIEKTFSPSTTRNNINYSSSICLLELNKKIYCPTIDINRLSQILSEISTSISSDINVSIKLSLVLTEYINILVKELLNDLKSRNNQSLKLLDKYLKYS